ncbi:MAG: glycosyltransferase, partial [Calditrichaeota bacterium]|nr:glycosyltransferase [Calditrichota bacterium]
MMEGAFKEKIDISIVIPNYNSTSYLLRCLSGIFAQKAECNYEVIVVDSSDDDPSEIVEREFPQVRCLHFEGRTYPG